MGRKGFSGTTLILVIVLLGTLIGIGTIVNPKPEGPPEQKKDVVGTDKPADPSQKIMANKLNKAAMDKQKMEMQEKYKKIYGEKMKTARGVMLPTKGAGPKTPPKQPFNPDTIEVDSSYFLNNPDGQEGTEQMLQKVAVAKKMLAEQRKGKPVTPPGVERPNAGHDHK